MSPAEILLDLARTVMVPKNQVVLIEDSPHHTADTVALALKFNQLSNATKLRAIMEDWMREQIVRELY